MAANWELAPPPDPGPRRAPERSNPWRKPSPCPAPISGTDKTLSFETGKLRRRPRAPSSPHRRHHGPRHRQRRRAASARASTSSPSPSTSRSGCTPPGRSPARSSAGRAAPPTRHPHLPAHRPPAAPVVRRGLPQRDPGRRHRPRRRPGEPPRRAGHQRRVGRADALGHPVRRARSAPCASPTRQDGEWIPHPTYEEGDESTFELVVAGRQASTTATSPS